MAYAFDGRALGQVLVETERLAEQSRDHERRLARLVQQLEGPSQPMNSDLLLEIRHLCVNTRDQRQQLEAMLARLVGTPPTSTRSPRVGGAGADRRRLAGQPRSLGARAGVVGVRPIAARTVSRR